jgi:hypothetical protein
MIAAHPEVPRLFMLEEEYRRAVLRAELEWLQSVIADLDAGTLTWSEEWIRRIGAEIGLPADREEGR